MTGCNRFEAEGFGRWENGAPPDEHGRSCPDCLLRRRAFDRLGRTLGREPDVRPLPAGWQARVLAAVEPASPAGIRRWRGWFFHPVAAGLVLAAILLLIRVPADDLPAIAADWSVVPAPQHRFRGGTGPAGAETEVAVPGDRLHIRGTVPPAAHVEVRVFRDGAVVFRCSSEAGCPVQAGMVHAEVALDLPGTYEALVAASARPLPAPAASRDADLIRVSAAGGRVAALPPLVVR